MGFLGDEGGGGGLCHPEATPTCTLGRFLVTVSGHGSDMGSGKLVLKTRVWSLVINNVKGLTYVAYRFRPW